jgi:hypothetical protein
MGNYCENQGNDRQSELFLNTYSQECVERLKLDILEATEVNKNMALRPEFHEVSHRP